MYIRQFQLCLFGFCLGFDSLQIPLLLTALPLLLSPGGVLPGDVPLRVTEQTEPGSLELLPDETQAEQPGPKGVFLVVGGAGGQRLIRREQTAAYASGDPLLCRVCDLLDPGRVRWDVLKHRCMGCGRAEGQRRTKAGGYGEAGQPFDHWFPKHLLF